MIPEGKNCKPDWRTDLVGGKGGKEQNQGTNCVRRHVSDALSPPPFPILLKVREKGKGRKRRIFFFPPHCWLDGLIGFLVPGPGFYVHKAWWVYCTYVLSYECICKYYGCISTKRERVRERVSEMISSILADTTSARAWKWSEKKRKSRMNKGVQAVKSKRKGGGRKERGKRDERERDSLERYTS